MFRYKQAIVVREDLGMSPGKLAAQVAHGAVAAAEKTRRENPEWFKGWLREGQKKVVLAAKNEKELRKLWAEASERGISCELIEDAGLTELPPGTVTVVGIGPAPSEKVDEITGKLPLL
ncbi:MAG: peptidyl-tRNA hydrolase Pth2 [Candidatus Hadarchaeales archaeon]